MDELPFNGFARDPVKITKFTFHNSASNFCSLTKNDRNPYSDLKKARSKNERKKRICYLILSYYNIIIYNFNIFSYTYTHKFSICVINCNEVFSFFFYIKFVDLVN